MQISPNRDHPPTKDIWLSLLKFSSKLGSVDSKCVQLISVNRDPTRNTWTVFVNVPVSAETPPRCDMFGGRSPHINFECESLETQDDEDNMRFKLDYSDALNRQLMDPLDSTEAQMFINWYLNGQIMGCPVIRYDITHHHFDKAAVISGPLPKTFCQEV
ncbi:unnamed protein product [Dicrocoelium dendriticum]|nr:unnamed protein product [Dicrocoelium dendriticum]